MAAGGQKGWPSACVGRDRGEGRGQECSVVLRCSLLRFFGVHRVWTPLVLDHVALADKVTTSRQSECHFWLERHVISEIIYIWVKPNKLLQQ